MILMPICKNCNSTISEEAEICPFCGQPLADSIKTKSSADLVPSKNSSSNESARISPQPIYQHVGEIDFSDQYVFTSPDTEELELQEYQEQTIPANLEPLPQRNYWLWFLLGVITLGIGFLIYLYINLEDLEKHSVYPNEFKAEDIEVNASSILLLFVVSICFFFIPILWYIYYKKYASLYYHLKDQKKDTAPYKLVHPAYYLSCVIVTNLLALVHPIIYTFTEIDIQMTIPAVFWAIVGLVIVFTIPTFILDYLWQRAYNAHAEIAMKNLGIHPIEEKK